VRSRDKSGQHKSSRPLFPTHFLSLSPAFFYYSFFLCLLDFCSRFAKNSLGLFGCCSWRQEEQSQEDEGHIYELKLLGKGSVVGTLDLMTYYLLYLGEGKGRKGLYIHNSHLAL
jgi:hypothetical protein